MSNFSTPTRLGQANNTGSTEALFYEKFSGRVDGLFREESEFIDRHNTKEAMTGFDTVSFPIHGRLGAQYHATAGSEIDPSALPLNKRTIGIDRPLWSGFLVDDGDRYVAAWQPDSYGVRECVDALRDRFDQNVAQVIAKAARSAGFVTGQSTGSTGGAKPATGDNNAWNTAELASGVSANANLRCSRTTPAELYTAIKEAGLQLDLKFVPKMGRYLALSPAEYWAMYDNASFLPSVNRDFAGQGSIARAEVPMVAGFQLVHTTHLPSTDIASAPAGVHSANATARAGDFVPTVALAWHGDAVGTAMAALPFTERSRQHRNFVDLFTCSYVIGHNILRPECAVEITDDDFVHTA